MATVSNKFSGTGNNQEFVWSPVATGDTVVEDTIKIPGKYSFAVGGTFANGSTAKLLVGPSSGPTKSISTDAAGTEWTSTAVTSCFLVGPFAAGTVIKPSNTGGSADGVSFYLRYIGPA